MLIERLNRSVALPFNLTELKEHCRVTHNYEDASLTRYGMAAATEIEEYAQIALLHQTIRMTLGVGFGNAWIDVPIIPVFEPTVVSILCDGVPYTSYKLVPGLRPAFYLGYDWPGDADDTVIVEYRAGFGASYSAIPADLQAAILDQACAFYDTRGAGDGKISGMSPHTARIAARYRRVRV